MQFLGLNIPVKNVPELDPSFIPLQKFNEAFLAGAKQPVGIAVERAGGEMASVKTFIYGTEEMRAADRYYIDRLVKTLLWMKGGFRVYVSGSEDIYTYLKEDLYRDGGKQDFDYHYFSEVFEHPFEIVLTDKLPENADSPKKIGGHLGGCRIGFDAGGSDRKVSAVIDGETVYSEEVVWYPKLSEDPTYQFNGIVEAFKTAASKMPRVDGIGVSSAGVFVGNAPMVSSLFIKVPRERREEVKTVYDRAAKEIGENVPIVVANDGDVTALAGSMSLDSGRVMGLAMGTSEAVGYVDENRDILGWYNELAFAPVDLAEDAMRDEWSGDIGVGCKYFSQDAVIKLAPAAGIGLAPELSPAEKLKEVQKLAAIGSKEAEKIFLSIGCYLAHTLALYSRFYDLKYLLVLGRVASGLGGETIVAECRRVLADEYPALAEKIDVTLPDEKFRRVGQSMAAASLPRI